MNIECIAITASRETREGVRRGLALLVGPTQVKAQCLDCHLYQEAANPDEFLLITKWATKEAMNEHISSDLYKTLLRLLESSVTPPRIDYYDIAEAKGLDLVRAAREKTLADEIRG